MYSQFEDIQLVGMISEDDTMAFEELYSRYAKNMFLFAKKILNCNEVCEDIVQTVFVEFWAKRKSKEYSNPKSYLFQCVKFQVFAHIRNQRITDENLARLKIIDNSMDSLEKIEFCELEALINELVSKLSPRCQEIFVLSRFHEKSHKEIAKELNISVQAVKNQINRALKVLRRDIPKEQIAVVLMFIMSSPCVCLNS